MTHQIRETLFNHVCTKFLRQSHCKMKMEQREKYALTPHALSSEAGFSNHNDKYPERETAGFVSLGVWLWWHTRPGNNLTKSKSPITYLLVDGFGLNDSGLPTASASAALDIMNSQSSMEPVRTPRRPDSFRTEIDIGLNPIPIVNGFRIRSNSKRRNL